MIGRQSHFWVPVIILMAGLVQVFWQVDLTLVREGIPGWDESSHMGDGAILLKLLRDGEILMAFERFYTMNLWPPFFRLVTMPLYAVGGYEFYWARGLVLATFIAVGPVLGVIAARLSPQVPNLAALVAAGLWLTSPFVLAFSGLAMLEIPGVLLTLGSLLFYLRWLQCHKLRDLRLCLLMATCLFFTKYNYGVLWFAVLMGHQWVSQPKLRQWVGGLFRQAITQRIWRQPVFVFFGLYLLVLLVVLSMGGLEFEVWDRAVTLKKLGNPSYGFALLLGIYLAIRFRISPQVAWRGWLKAGPEVQAVFGFVLAPMLLWFCNPLNWAAFVSFLFNHERLGHGGGVFSAENLLFYPTLLSDQYWTSPAHSFLLIAVLGLALLTWRQLSSSLRLVLLAGGLYFALLVIHRHHAPRHLVIFFPWACLLLAQGPQLLGSFSRTLVRQQRALGGAFVALLVGLGLVWTSPMAPKSAAVLQHWFLPAANGAVMRALCETAKPNQRTVVLGYWHDINPGATTFACLKQAPGLSYGAFPKAPRWRHLDKKNPDHQRFLRVTDFDQYVTLDYEGTDRQTIYQQETAYMRPLPEILSQHPDFKPIKKQRVGNYSLNIYSREGNQVAGSQDLLKYLREQR